MVKAQSTEGFKRPLLLSLAAAMIVLLVVSAGLVKWDMREHLRSDLRGHVNGVRQILPIMLEKEGQIMHGMIDVLKDHKDLQKSFKSGNRQELLRLARPIFDGIKNDFGITHLYFHQADGVNFLRVHSPKRFGDPIDRLTLERSRSTGVESSGLELGPLGTFTLRMVHPWQIDGRIGGYIELGMEMQEVLPELKRCVGADLLVLVEKKRLDRQRWEEGQRMLGRNGDWDRFPNLVVLARTAAQLPAAMGRLAERLEEAEAVEFIDLEEEEGLFLVGTVPLLDAGGQKVGMMAVQGSMGPEKSMLRDITLIFSVLGGSLLLFFWLVLSGVERKLRQRSQELQAEIEERRQSERALLESEERYRDLFENAHDLIQIVDPEGRLQFVNRAWRETFGYSSEEIRNLSVFDIIDPGCQEECGETFKRVLSVGEVPDIHATFTAKSGAQVMVEGSATCKMSDGKPVSTRCIFRDVTNQKKLQQQLMQSQKLEAIGTLAGGIAHDFNNILTAILGYAQLALAGVDRDSELHGNLQQIIKSARRATSLVQQILTFSRKRQEEEKPLLIQMMLKEDIKLLRQTTPVTIRIEQEIDDDCPPVLIDATEMNQLFMNLFINACQALKNEGGTIRVGLHRMVMDERFLAQHPNLASARCVRLSVADDGQGMATEQLGRIFEPYFTTKEKESGTGLGLAIVHGIVQSHGGEVVVSSEAGVGSLFEVYLPACEAGMEEAEVPPRMALPRVGAHVMYVDDEVDIVVFGKAALERIGCTVEGFSDSMAAFEAFLGAPGRYDLVITDQTMPNLTGCELSRRMLAVRPELPIILCTGYSSSVNEQVAREIGIREFMMKPLEFEALVHCVQRLVPTAVGRA